MTAELRSAARLLRRAPGYSLALVAILAVSIGGNTAVFTIVRAVLLRPLPYPHAAQIMQAWQSEPRGEREVLSPYNIEDWGNQSKTLEQISAYGYENYALLGRSIPLRVRAIEVTGGFFEVFRIPPLLGRTLNAGDEKVRAHVAVLSYGAWEKYFGGDPGLAGKTVTLDARVYTIVGVMPKGFAFPDANVDLWAPPSTDWLARGRRSSFLFAVARIRDGISVVAAQAEADAISARLRAEYPQANRDVAFRLVPLQDQIVGRSRAAIVFLAAAVAAVLLIACTNIVALLLAHAAGRRREMATRTALGATRLRLVKQVMTETLLLSTLGGGAGLLLGYEAVRLITSSFPGAIPRAPEVHVDAVVLLFTLCLSVLCGLLFGLAPAFSFSAVKIVPSLKQGMGASSGGGSPGLRRALLGTELALSVALLISASLVVRSLWLLHAVSPGFDTRRTLGMRISVSETQLTDFVGRAHFYARIIDRLRAVPGVLEAGATNDLPFSGSRTETNFEIAGRPQSSQEREMEAGYRTIAGDYFRALQIPLVRGRFFHDDAGPASSRVAVINQALARRFFPGEDPVGQRLRLKGELVEIIGIAGNVKHEQLMAEDHAEIYVPQQQAHTPPWTFFIVNTAGEPNALVGSIRSAVAEVAPEQPLYDIRTMDVRVENSIASERLTAIVLACFAGIALLLAAMGVYGVFAFSTAQRTREIGIRMALGADSARVLGMFLRESLLISIVAAGAGLLLAASASSLLNGLLFGVKPLDPGVYAGAACALVSVALAGSYIPARRAARVQPTVTLRYE